MSETPTTTTSQKSIAIHLQFVLQHASYLYCSAFGATGLSGKGNTSEILPFVSQYASHFYRSTPPICIAIRLPFVSQCFGEKLGGCGHRDVPQRRGKKRFKCRGCPKVLLANFSFCPGDTRHSCLYFVDFRGLRSKIPCCGG